MTFTTVALDLFFYIQIYAQKRKSSSKWIHMYCKLITNHILQNALFGNCLYNCMLFCHSDLFADCCFVQIVYESIVGYSIGVGVK